MNTHYLYIIVFLLAQVFVASAQDKIEPLFPCTKVLEEQYGITAHVTRKSMDWNYRDRDFAICKEIGINYVRADLDLSGVVPDTLKPYKTEHLDSVIVSAKKAGVKMVPILGYYTSQIKQTWRHLDIWEKYVRLMSEKYGKEFSYWEVWNEENHKRFWNAEPNGEQYTVLLNKTYKTLKTLEPNYQVLLGAIGADDSKYVEQLLKSGAGSHFDIMNFHAYCDAGLPEVQMVNYFRIYAKYQFCKGKHIWLTETGFSTRGSYKVTEEQQAQYLPRTFLLAFASGIDKVFWYNLRAMELEENNREYHFGILHKDLTPKLAYYSFKTLTTMCPSGSTRPSIEINDGVYVATWKTTNGKVIKAYWTKSDKKTVYLNKRRTMYDYVGKKFKSRIFSASPSITYVEY